MPFKLVRAGSGRGVVAVFGHEALAAAAPHNSWSAQMHARLQNLARTRFDVEFDGTAYSNEDLGQIIAICGDAIPADVLEKLSAAQKAGSVVH